MVLAPTVQYNEGRDRQYALPGDLVPAYALATRCPVLTQSVWCYQTYCLYIYDAVWAVAIAAS
eukprot:274769-Rhodomonas_salina.1